MRRSATVTRLQDDQLQIQWPQGQFSAPVSICWGDALDGAASEYQPLATVAQGYEVVVADPSPGRRSYFKIMPNGGRPLLAAERCLPLEGEVNFRDLGGYGTADGRRVRWGQLYRSGDLSHLSGADLAYLEQLGLKLVCDLRVDFEIQRAPDRLPEGAARLNLPIPGGEIPDEKLYAAVDGGDLSVLDGDYLISSNRMFVREFTPAYRQMVRRLADGDNRPAVFHCTAGKDRAGLGAAIILLVLGVPVETVFDDYLLTNRCRADWTEQTLALIRQAIVARHGARAEAVDLSPMEALLVARRAYLASALGTIDRDYGSFEAYTREGLGLSREAQEAFRESLLEQETGAAGTG